MVSVSPPDSDGDGYSDAAEVAIGKDPFTYCGVMRADVDGDGVVTILDLSRVAKWYGQAVPPAPKRLTQGTDLQISILDLAKMASYYFQPVSVCP